MFFFYLSYFDFASSVTTFPLSVHFCTSHLCSLLEFLKGKLFFYLSEELVKERKEEKESSFQKYQNKKDEV